MDVTADGSSNHTIPAIFYYDMALGDNMSEFKMILELHDWLRGVTNG